MPRTETDIREQLQSVARWLKAHDPVEAPENFYCDGEISADEAKRRWNSKVAEFRRLKEELQALEASR